MPPRERARYQGYLASIFMASSALGPVAGGWLTQHFGWQSVFLVNVPLGALAAVLALRLPGGPPSGGRIRFDWPGLVLFAGFVVALLLALERAQRITFAALPGVVGYLVVAGTALFLLLRQERRTASPLIPVGLLRHPAIWRADAMGACAGAIIVSSVTFMPVYLQVVRGVTPGMVGLLMLPLTVGIACGSLLTGRLISRTGRTAIFPSVGQAVVCVCWVFLAAAAAGVPTPWLPAVFLLMSLAAGTTMPVVQITVQVTGGPKNLGASSASVQFSRSIGAALGTALVGAVLFAVLAVRDPAMAALFAEVVQRGPAVLDTVSAASRTLLASEIALAFRAAFLTVAGFSFMALLLAWAQPMRRL